jgi:hypothetical protein
MLGANVRADFYMPDDPVQGTQRATARERRYLINVAVKIEPTSTQKLAVRQAGELRESAFTGYIDPPEVAQRWPLPCDVLTVTLCHFANDPMCGKVGTRFEITDSAASVGEVRLSLTELDS